jgi:hypothetical protein
MIKYFCDECKKELSIEEVQFSLDVIGKELCGIHAKEYIEMCQNKKYKIDKIIRPVYNFKSGE